MEPPSCQLRKQKDLSVEIDTDTSAVEAKLSRESYRAGSHLQKIYIPGRADSDWVCDRDREGPG